MGLNVAHNKFSDRLKQARLEKAAREGREVRQVDAADEMEISRSAYNQWESGGTEPKGRAVYERLAKYMDVSPGWLAFGIPLEEDQEVAAPRPTKLSKGRRA